MLDGTASARLGRAVNTRTTMAAQHLGLKKGDEVDFYRNPSAKDVTGWHGPATVADLTRLTRGSVQVKWQGQLLEVTTQNVRHHLGYWVFLAADHKVQQAHIHTNIWQTIKGELHKMSSGQVVQLGHILHHYLSWKWAKRTATQYQLYNA